MTFAGVVDQGAFTPPGSNAGANVAFAKLPAFCRVAATLTPTSDSDIKIEVWLPVSSWNQKLQAVGNGGWAGTISVCRDGRALLARATRPRPPIPGTPAPGASVRDESPGEARRLRVSRRPRDDGPGQGHRRGATTAAARELSMWNGCSTGGRQGVNEAPKYPADYDGIIAGATP